MIASLKSYMADKEKMRLQPLVIAWNFGLSFFSICGLIYCVPHLLFNERSGVISAGFYPSVCSHASAYGFGEVGFWVFLFIYSKLAELIDTLFLLLRKSPVILLHWYHHMTVLLYCWHAYSVRIGTGLWFASMNYSVHAIMYFYFGLTQCGPAGRKFAKNFAMLITSLQLLQMVVGIVVTVASVVYHANGKTCYVSLFNSLLGLVMYSSYFALFLQVRRRARACPCARACAPHVHATPTLVLQLTRAVLPRSALPQPLHLQREEGEGGALGQEQDVPARRNEGARRRRRRRQQGEADRAAQGQLEEDVKRPAGRVEGSGPWRDEATRTRAEFS